MCFRELEDASNNNGEKHEKKRSQQRELPRGKLDQALPPKSLVTSPNKNVDSTTSSEGFLFSGGCFEPDDGGVPLKRPGGEVMAP